MAPFIIAQIISILSGVFLLKSMRSKSKDKFLVLNSISNLLGFLSLIVLQAYAATVGPIVLTIQGIITHNYEKKGKKQPKALLVLYLLLNILGGAFTVKSLLGVLPVLSSSLASIMLMSKDMKTSRKINLVSSIIGLPYLIANKAYVSAIIFGSSFINTLDAIRKLDYKKEDSDVQKPVIEESSSFKKEKTMEKELKTVVKTHEYSDDFSSFEKEEEMKLTRKKRY